MSEIHKIQKDAPGKKSRFIPPRFNRFLIFLGISICIWLAHELSKKYSERIKLPVRFENLPRDKSAIAAFPDSLEALVSGNGFALLAENLFGAANPVVIDAHDVRELPDGSYVLLVNKNGRQETGRGITVSHLYPDSLFFSFKKIVEKSVPVRVNADVHCAPLFRMSDSVSAQPSQVKVSGTEDIVSRISFVETEKKNYSALDHDVDDVVSLVLPQGVKQADVDPASVHLIIHVGKFTEGKITVPVEVINLPAGAKATPIPDKVTLTYRVAVSDYASINAGMFRVVADYNSISPGQNFIPVEIIRMPLNVQNISADHKQVDFVIRFTGGK